MLGTAYEKVAGTFLVIAIFLLFRVVLGKVVRRKLSELTGHHKLTNLISGIVGAAFIMYILHIWGVIKPLLEFFTAVGIVGVVIFLAAKDVWLNNIFAGISLAGDKSVDIGSKVEISGARGEIIEMTFMATKIRTDEGHLMIVPNKIFMENVVVVLKNRE